MMPRRTRKSKARYLRSSQKPKPRTMDISKAIADPAKKARRKQRKRKLAQPK